MTHKLEGFKSSPVVNDGEIKRPQLGRVNLTVDKLFFTNDRVASLNEPRLKDKLPEWKDATEQVAVVLISEDGGVMVRRFNAMGFKRMEDFTDEQIEEMGLIELGSEGYAVVESSMTRIEDPVRSNKALAIIDQFMYACGLPEGSELKDCKGQKFSAEVFIKEWGESQNYDIKNFRRISDDKIVDVTKKVEVEAEEDLEY